MKVIIFLILVFPMPIITNKNNFPPEYPKKKIKLKISRLAVWS